MTNTAPSEFSTQDRFCFDPKNPKQLGRALWTTTVSGWQTIDERPLPVRAEAVWHLPGGPFAYADFHLLPETLAYNVPPGI